MLWFIQKGAIIIQTIESVKTNIIKKGRSLKPFLYEQIKAGRSLRTEAKGSRISAGALAGRWMVRVNHPDIVWELGLLRRGEREGKKRMLMV